MEHIRLLLDIGELNWVFKDSADVESLLQNIVIMVARHMGADVCSIYINDERRNELVLRANVGLSPGTAGKIRLKPGEGIVGTCFADLTPVCTRDSFTHPNFKYFSKTDEDRYKAFLAVPIVSGSLRVGVLVLQRKEEYHFTEDDTLALKVIASQLANMVENVKLLTSMKGLAPAAISPQKPQFKTRFIKGKPAARGYAYGRIVVIDNDRRFSDLETVAFDHSYSIDDFTDAVKTSYVQLETLQKQAERTIADAASLIFTSHLLILKDREFQEKIEMLIRKGKNPPEAVLTVARKYIQVFLASPVEHLQEKSKDIEDIATRILVNMLKQETVLPGLKGRIVIMRETYPSDILRLALEKIKGAIVTSGGTTSHVSILAGSLGLPLIIANEPALLNIDRDAKVLMDAELGNVYVNPEKEVLEGFRDKLQTAKHEMSAAMTPRTLTADGIRVRLMANVNLLKDLELLQKLSCDGIGLYRSEFPFIVRNNFPTEEEQYFVYRKLVEGLPGKQITFRTLDIGGDKELPYAGSLRRDNPFLGLRSIRFSLKHREIFADQIRAILRAGAGADIRIMFPMVFSLEEFAAAKGVVQECLETLSRQGRPYNAAPKTGMMVEVPAVIDIIDDFGAIADFFSIGTNDLIQYLLAVDRTNEEVAEYYLPHHPAVLRAIHRVAAAAARHDVDVSVCGTMANTKAYLPFLIGAGITTLSMNPQYLAESQKIIAAIDAKAAREMAGRLLKLSQIPEIEKILFGAAEPEI
jgi:phosphotransferase system enzyme I (PtsP)